MTYQLKIQLDASKPEIWRRILVSGGTTLFELHHIIQIAMEWTNSHLYEFALSSQRFGTKYDDDEEFYDEHFTDAQEVTIDGLGLRSKSKLNYLYDFGDYWKHTITVEKTGDPDSKTKLPLCLDGERHCPPEDCGGIYGYYDMLKVLQTEDHPEREEYLEWLGEDFDPTHFDITMVNKQLKNLDQYISEFLDENELNNRP